MNQVWWGKESEFWRGLPAALQSKLSQCGTTRHWETGAQLLAQGDEEGIVAVKEGRVKLISHRGGERELTLARLGQGEVFGRATWLQEGVAGVHAEVVEPLYGWHVDREALEKLLREAPELTKALADTVHRLWQVGGPVGPASGRIRRLLTMWGNDHGQAGPQGILVPGILAPAEIAELVGATREEVERCLRAWRAEGVIREEADHFWLRSASVAAP